jgi:phosphoribosylaminoimidazole carboxylase (NCAIR synthetase)
LKQFKISSRAFFFGGYDGKGTRRKSAKERTRSAAETPSRAKEDAIETGEESERFATLLRP